MERPLTTVAIGALSVAVVLLLIFRGRGERPPPPPDRAPLVVPTLSAPAMPLGSVALPTSLPQLALAAPSSSRPLPVGAPKALRFGVVLFQYRGAQLAVDATRSREDALVLAKSSVDLARRDFKAAVKQGDVGSTEDAGRVTRGILEPNVELDLFSLSPGSVSEPIDTPRGFWLARRIE